MSVYRNRRDELENQLNKGALWAVTYGDLMSYIAIFFLMLYAANAYQFLQSLDLACSYSDIVADRLGLCFADAYRLAYRRLRSSGLRFL